MCVDTYVCEIMMQKTSGSDVWKQQMKLKPENVLMIGQTELFLLIHCCMYVVFQS